MTKDIYLLRYAISMLYIRLGLRAYNKSHSLLIPYPIRRIFLTQQEFTLIVL